MTTEDTGRRCPRCDCPDGHQQCDHCKTCPPRAPEDQPSTHGGDVTERHTLSRTTRVEDTDAWLQRHGATRRVTVTIQQPGQPDRTAHIGDTLIWDGHTISVEPRERRP